MTEVRSPRFFSWSTTFHAQVDVDLFQLNLYLQLHSYPDQSAYSMGDELPALARSMEELRIGPFRISHEQGGGTNLGRGCLERIRMRLGLEVKHAEGRRCR